MLWCLAFASVMLVSKPVLFSGMGKISQTLQRVCLTPSV